MPSIMRLASTAMLLGALARADAVAQQRTITGFNLAYATPTGWSLAGQDGRAEAWSQPSGSALFVFGGSYSSAELALADASSVLQGIPEQEPQVVEPPGLRRVGGVEATTTTLRVRGGDGQPIVVRLLTRLTTHGTALGVVTLSRPADDGAARSAAEGVLVSLRAMPPTPDAAEARALAGSWSRQESNMSSTSPGGYVAEEGWDFAADGTFLHWRNQTVSLPGAAVEPERSRESGQWQVIGGALVVSTAEGRTTVTYARSGREVTIDGTRLTRR